MFKYSINLHFETEKPMSISEVRRLVEGAVQSEANGSHPEDAAFGIKKVKTQRIARVNPKGETIA